MFRAVWNGAILAESGDTVKSEGNRYVPVESLRWEYFTASPVTSTCRWKGQAWYYNVTVGGKVNRDAAWYYPHSSPAASEIAGHVAFWRGVRIERVPGSDGETVGSAGHGPAGRVRARLHPAGARR